MPDIFDEVEEDLRADKARALARRFGWLAALAVLTIVLGTGAYVWWQDQQKARNEVVAAQYLAAQKLADPANVGTPSPAALKSFADVAASAPAGYQVLARLRLGSLQWQSGQTAQAIATWQALSADTAAPKMLRDLATLTNAQHQTDTGDAAALKSSLLPLTASDNPWRPLAEQTMALLDIRLGKPQDAAKILRRLANDQVLPQNQRQLASDLLLSIGQDPGAQEGPGTR